MLFVAINGVSLW